MGKIVVHSKVTGHLQLGGLNDANNSAQIVADHFHRFDKPAVFEVSVFVVVLHSVLEIVINDEEGEIFKIEEAAMGETMLFRFHTPNTGIHVTVQSKGPGIEVPESCPFNFSYSINSVHD